MKKRLREAFTKSKQKEILQRALELLFELKSNGNVKTIRTYKEVRALLSEVTPGFNNEAGRAVTLRNDNIGILLRQAFADIHVTVSIDDGNEEERRISSKVETLRKLHSVELLAAAPNAHSEMRANFKLAELAAKCFGEVVGNHRSSHTPVVGIGGGQTIHQMMWWLKLPQSLKMTVIPLNYVTRIPEEEVYDSSYLAMHAHWLCSDSRAKILSMPPLPSDDAVLAAKWHSELFYKSRDIRKTFAQSKDPDIVFVGTGNFYSESPSISRIYSSLGIDFKTLDKMNPRPVGDINLCFFDKSGQDLTSQILAERVKKFRRRPAVRLHKGSLFKDEPHCHPFLVGLNVNCLKNLVKKKKKVVVVAGGRGVKAPAIHTLLSAGIVNGLITDEKTVDELIKLKTAA